MPNFAITDVSAQDGHLVVTAEHYNADGSVWFTENYIFQGREWHKRKRAANALGQLLLDDGAVAPTTVRRRGPPDELEPFLPAGRTWKLRPGPHMVDDSILSVIASTHQRRLASSYPQGHVDRLGSFKAAPEDTSGAADLAAHFLHLKGRAV